MDPSSAVHDPAEGSHVEDGVVEHPTAEDFGHARALPEDARNIKVVDLNWAAPTNGTTAKTSPARRKPPVRRQS